MSKQLPIQIEAPIDQVQVLEDRALIHRTGKCQLTAGKQLLQFPVTPLLVNRSLRVQLLQDNHALVTDHHIRRTYQLRGARPQLEKKLTHAIENLVDEYAAVSDHFSILQQQFQRNFQTTTHFSQYIQEQLAIGALTDEWIEHNKILFERQSYLLEKLLNDQYSQTERNRRIQRLVEEHRQAVSPLSEYTAQLITELWIETAGEYQLSWHYLVPCAVWRPTYIAELEESKKYLHWHSTGMVWQITGEDWNNVELSCSTARPALGARMPLLTDDIVTLRDKTNEEKQVIKVTSQEQKITKTTQVQEKYWGMPPGLEDGGEARIYAVPNRVSVPSDGCPYRFPFNQWDTAIELEWICVAEKSEHVFMRTMQKNPTTLPLLAGPVELNVNGNFVGRGEISYIASQETFALSWGSDDNFVVLRHSERKYKESKVLKKRHYQYNITTYLANYTDTIRQIRVMDRIPVSEIQQVHVKLDSQNSSAGYQMDKQGIVEWDIKLQVAEEKQLKLQFDIEMPQKVQWD